MVIVSESCAINVFSLRLSLRYCRQLPLQVTLQVVASFTIVIYNCKMFIIEGTSILFPPCRHYKYIIFQIFDTQAKSDITKQF